MDTQVEGGVMLPDRSNLLICAIEDREYKQEKIECALSPALPPPKGWMCLGVEKLGLTSVLTGVQSGTMCTGST